MVNQSDTINRYLKNNNLRTIPYGIFGPYTKLAI